MERRKAIQNIAAISAGAVLLPSCDFGLQGPQYSNIPLEGSQRRLIKQFINSLLPKNDLELNTPESTDGEQVIVQGDLEAE